MNESDIEFTVGLDVSDADKKLDSIQQKMNSAFSGSGQGYTDRDAFAYERMRLIKERNDLNRAARSFYSEAYSRASSGDMSGAAIMKSNAADAAAQFTLTADGGILEVEAVDATVFQIAEQTLIVHVWTIDIKSLLCT